MGQNGEIKGVEPRPASPTVIEAGIDWLTLTAPADGRDGDLLDRADRVLALSEADGHEPAERDWKGYALRRAGQVTCGLGPQGALVELKGAWAARYWHEVLPYGRTVTRLDAQVTVRPAPADPHLSHGHYLEVLRWKIGRQRAPQVTWMGSERAFQTVYVGAGQSESRARIYDKAAESGEESYRDAWRYEVQLRKPLAGRQAHILWAQRDRQAAVLAYVSEYFRRRGIYARFGRQTVVPMAAGGKQRGDDERRLRYIYDVVRPLLFGLAERGRGVEALQLAGLRQELAEEAARQMREPVEGLANGRVLHAD